MIWVWLLIFSVVSGAVGVVPCAACGRRSRMSEVVVRQWSDRVFAGYAEIGGRWMLVGTEESRQAAYDFTLNVVNDPLEVRNRCYRSLFTARRRVLERVSVRQFEGESDGPTCVNTPARLAPDNAGATP